MKKMNNKGFSLVELIIVIAIMAILAGALAPALLRYIEKTRVSNDKTTAANVKTAVETALANEDVMDDVSAAVDADGWLYFEIKPATSNAVAQYPTTCPESLQKEIEQTLSSKKLKIKSKKDLDNTKIGVAIALGGAGQADVTEVYLISKDGTTYIDTQGVEKKSKPAYADLISGEAGTRGSLKVTVKGN